MSKNKSICPSVLFILGVIALILLTAIAPGCTKNERAKSFGGTQTITLAPGETLINVTWKNSDMWVLVQLPSGGKEFREYSSFGIMNGKIVFK